MDEKITAAGYAVGRQYEMYFKADRTGPCISWIVWVPRWAKKPAPVWLFLDAGTMPDVPCRPVRH